MRQRKLRSKIDLARKKLNTNQIDEAISLLTEAKHLSFYQRDGLKVSVINEKIDCEMWNELNKKVETLPSAKTL